MGPLGATFGLFDVRSSRAGVRAVREPIGERIGRMHNFEPHCRVGSSGSSDSASLPPHVGFVFEWVQEIDSELVKVVHVAGHDRQPMHQGPSRRSWHPPAGYLNGDA